MRSPVSVLALASALALVSPVSAHPPRAPELPVGQPIEAPEATADAFLQLDEVAPDEALLGRPRTQDESVVYLIVTNRRLAPVFWSFARWKTHHGSRATVRTVEWIRHHYDGRDDAERVREFLKDAHSHWAARWLLLGGDSTTVPIRLASVAPSAPGLPDVIPTDWYYACLDGNWDANGNGLFGELPVPGGSPGDDPDLVPELNVGRAPVSTRAEARSFTRRTREAYETPPADFVASTLLAAGSSGSPQDPFPFFLAWGSALEPLVGPLRDSGRDVLRLYAFPSTPPIASGADSLTHDALIHALDAGPSVVALAFNTGLAGLSTDGQSVDVTDADLMALTNRGRLGHVAAVGAFTCSPGSASVARALLTAPHGGAVSVYGPTAASYSAATNLMRDYLERVAGAGAMTLGEASSARGEGQQANWPSGGYLYALFGDPQLRVPAASQAGPSIVRSSGPLASLPASTGTSFTVSLTNPVRERLRVAWSANAAGNIDVDVYDMAGRHVAAVTRGSSAASGEESWDLRDRRGTRVSPGVYLVRAASGAHTVTRHVVVLP